MMLLRVWRHIKGIVLFYFQLPVCVLLLMLKPRSVCVCLSVDGDSGGMKNAIPKGTKTLLGIFDKEGVRGKVTWFVNFKEGWTEKYNHLLNEIIARGDRVELHLHLEQHILAENAGVLTTEIGEAKVRLEQCCNQSIPGYRVFGFRSGDLARSQALFVVLEKLGFVFDSSIAHGTCWKIGDHLISDKDVPLSRNCYFLDPGEFKAPSATPKALVEIPLWHSLPPLLPALVRNIEPLVITFFVHPYGFVTEKDNMNYLAIIYYHFLIRSLKLLPRVQFCTLSQAQAMWRQKYEMDSGK